MSWRAWVWKREGKSDQEKYDLPYSYEWNDDADVPDAQSCLTIEQARFTKEGFASTVWDSAIVLSKFMENNRDLVCNKTVLELGAGCGLPAIVASHLGANVVTTDLDVNLDLLGRNVQTNAPKDPLKQSMVVPLRWGDKLVDKQGTELEPFDVIIAADIMYINEAIPDLVKTLSMYCKPTGVIYMAYGRNCFAEDDFLAHLSKLPFVVDHVSPELLDVKYRCDDVTILQIGMKTDAGRKGKKKKKKRTSTNTRDQDDHNTVHQERPGRKLGKRRKQPRLA